MARSPTILLVEDDPNDIVLIRMAFQRTFPGVPIKVATHGLEALEYLKGEGRYGDRKEYPLPNLVLLDIKMPLMDGFEVLLWMREQPGLKRLPVIVLSSSLHEGDAKRAYDSGANSFLIKPADFDRLVQTLQRLGDFWLIQTRLPEASAD